MKMMTRFIVCCALAGCAQPQPAQEPQAGPEPSAEIAQPMAPDTEKALAHLRQHVQYPATREQVLAACANTPEFSEAEQTWFAANLPAGNYASAEAVIVALPIQSAPPAAAPAAPTGPEPKSYAEIRQTFGSVPTFFKVVPANLVDTAWGDFKGTWLQETQLSPKLKDLISVAVASQIPCRYCIQSDTEFALLDGASQQELQEAILMAATTRRWSTVLNGSLQDDRAFQGEADRIFANVRRAMKEKKAPRAIVVTDGKSAKEDIKGIMGLVPSFFEHYPEKMLPGAWLMMKQVQLNPATALSGKDKELIGMAVASQIPCKYCLYFHREAAKLNGATQQEVDEAVAIASDTRFWSTYMHGVQLDEKVFAEEIKAIVERMKAQMAEQSKPQN